MMLHYTGFRTFALGREYGFSLTAPEVPERVFTVLIPADAFGPRLLKFQDGPDLCYGKLQILLASEEEAGPVACTQRVTDSDIELYQSAGRTKGRKWTEEQRLAAKARAKAQRAAV